MQPSDRSDGLLFVLPDECAGDRSRPASQSGTGSVSSVLGAAPLTDFKEK
jgi:hypothetical protein